VSIRRPPVPDGKAWDVAGVVVPCVVVAVTVAAGWAWWVAAPAAAAALVVYAFLAGRERGAISALYATAGVVLVVERRGAGPLPVRLVDLGVMVVLLALSAAAGGARPPSS
jgi:hypothetical protein